MTYARAFSNYWWEQLRTDGVWRTDPQGNLVTLYRFLRDLRVMQVSVPGQGRLIDTIGEWFGPDRDRVDDGRAVYLFGFGEFGVAGDLVLAQWPDLIHQLGRDRYWSEGKVLGDQLSWAFSPCTGSHRPVGYRPPSVASTGRFLPVASW